MVQPYVTAVDDHGETALLYMDGAYSHAIRKGPILQPGTGFVETLYAPEDISARTPSDAERALGERVLAATPGGAGALAYARVDLLPGPGGEPLLIEYEIAEPSLFLEHDDGAAARLASAIARRVAGA